MYLYSPPPPLLCTLCGLYKFSRTGSRRHTGTIKPGMGGGRSGVGKEDRKYKEYTKGRQQRKMGLGGGRDDKNRKCKKSIIMR